MMSKKKSFIFLLIVLMLPATHGNVKILASQCSGTIFKMPEMKDYQKALILTSGHCIGRGRINGIYPDKNEVFINALADSFVKIKSVDTPLGKRFHYSKIIFATTTLTDLAILELDDSYQILKKNNISIYEVSKHPVTKGLELDFISANKGLPQRCVVEDIVEHVVEGPWVWFNVIRVKKSSDCLFVNGQSGTAGVSPVDGLIYAIAQTVYEGGQPCTLENPCEKNNQGDIIIKDVGTSYLATVDILYNYYDSKQAAFNFSTFLQK